MLVKTQEIMVSPMVTNPGRLDWSVFASLFATINEMCALVQRMRIGRAGNLATDFVLDEIVDRFCLFGSVVKHVAKLPILQDWVSTSSRSISCIMPRNRRLKLTRTRCYPH